MWTGTHSDLFQLTAHVDMLLSCVLPELLHVTVLRSVQRSLTLLSQPPLCVFPLLQC